MFLTLFNRFRITLNVQKYTAWMHFYVCFWPEVLPLVIVAPTAETSHLRKGVDLVWQMNLRLFRESQRGHTNRLPEGQMDSRRTLRTTHNLDSVIWKLTTKNLMSKTPAAYWGACQPVCQHSEVQRRRQLSSSAQLGGKMKRRHQGR